jgi:hypothetical protein
MSSSPVTRSHGAADPVAHYSPKARSVSPIRQLLLRLAQAIDAGMILLLPGRRASSSFRASATPLSWDAPRQANLAEFGGRPVKMGRRGNNGELAFKILVDADQSIAALIASSRAVFDSRSCCFM